MIQQLTLDTIRNPYTRKTFRTLTKHDDAGRFDTEAALRLLRRNVRDVQPNASDAVQQAVARALLTYWRESST